jgi:hypothetical protein
MITILNIAEYISLIPFVYWSFLYIYYFLYTIKIVPFVFSIKYIFGFTTIVFISENLKKIVFEKMKPLSKRPKDACGCDFFSIKGNVGGNPGLPSTHMSIVSYFAFYNMLIINTYCLEQNRLTFHSLNIIFLIFTGWSRYYKKCHNIEQILTGILLGSIYAYMFHLI